MQRFLFYPTTLLFLNCKINLKIKISFFYFGHGIWTIKTFPFQFGVSTLQLWLLPSSHLWVCNSTNANYLLFLFFIFTIVYILQFWVYSMSHCCISQSVFYFILFFEFCVYILQSRFIVLPCFFFTCYCWKKAIVTYNFIILTFYCHYEFTSLLGFFFNPEFTSGIKKRSYKEAIFPYKFFQS